MDVTTVAPFTNVECPACGKHTRVKREFGPYTLVRRHAMGGMSMVFAAFDNTLNREVALKILSEDYSADEKRIAAFEQEAHITASFSHPNVVRVLTTGRAFGRLYIAMEFVPGGHFEHQIRERGKIPEREMLALAIEVAQGLKAAHAAGLIHRDVKPGNILLDSEGHAKLVDFGLALVTHGGKAQATELWATPYYVPPETVEGYSEDFRSDIYAFGATLYHALSGKPPCGVESMATDLLRVAKKRVIPLHLVDTSISAETCRIVESAMAYNPAGRFSSYDELIAALTQALNHAKAGPVAPSQTAAKRRANKKRRERIVLVAAIVAVPVVAGLVITMRNFRKPAVVDLPKPELPHVVPQIGAPDNSVGIMKSYRDARTAVEAKNFEKAASGFYGLHCNSAVQEPTRTWAGVEAVLASYLDGRGPDARRLSREVADHVRSLPKGGTSIDEKLLNVIDKLTFIKPLPEPELDYSDASAAQVVAAMLAGLKDWEQGMPDLAAACFSVVVSCKLPQEDQWASVYQKMAGDYLADHEILSGPLFSSYPPDKEGCESAIENLNTVLNQLKTRGRAKFNVRAWQLDLARHAKLLSLAANTSPGGTGVAGKKTPDLPDLLAKLEGFSRDCRFPEAVSYLKSLTDDPQGAKLASLLSMAESSMAFLSDLEEDLGKEPVSVAMQTRNGGTMVRISIDSDGEITATDTDGQSRTCKWSDFTPGSLIDLHRVLVRNPKNETERVRRHECAIAYDWLAGERARAVSAAEILAEGSPEFKQRWEGIASGLPK